MRRALANATGRFEAGARGRTRPRSGASPASRRLLLTLGVALVCALAVAAMRNDLLRVQYGLAQALEETRALERERNLTLARVQALRDPARLTGLAAKRGFARPKRIVDLPAAPPSRATAGRP